MLLTFFCCSKTRGGSSFVLFLVLLSFNNNVYFLACLNFWDFVLRVGFVSICSIDRLEQSLYVFSSTKYVQSVLLHGLPNSVPHS